LQLLGNKSFNKKEFGACNRAFICLPKKVLLTAYRPQENQINDYPPFIKYCSLFIRFRQAIYLQRFTPPNLYFFDCIRLFFRNFTEPCMVNSNG